MQLVLSLVPLSPIESQSLVWKTLDLEQRNQTVTVLARLIAKTASAAPNQQPDENTMEQSDE
jgi:hypothetical protein